MPGWCDDRQAFSVRALGLSLYDGGLPSPFFLVVDAAYESSGFMLTPYPGRLGAGLNLDQDSFNFYQARSHLCCLATYLSN